MTCSVFSTFTSVSQRRSRRWQSISGRWSADALDTVTDQRTANRLRNGRSARNPLGNYRCQGGRRRERLRACHFVTTSLEMTCDCSVSTARQLHIQAGLFDDCQKSGFRLRRVLIHEGLPSETRDPRSVEVGKVSNSGVSRSLFPRSERCPSF